MDETTVKDWLSPEEYEERKNAGSSLAISAIEELDDDASGTDRLNAITSAYTRADVEDMDEVQISTIQDFAMIQYKNGGGLKKLNDDLIGQAVSGYNPSAFANSEELLTYNKEWEEKAKAKFRVLGGVEYVIGQKLYDEVLDDYKTTLDREATGKDTGYFADKLYRFAEGAGTFATSAFNATNLQKSLQNWTAENPKYDEDLAAKLAGAFGQVAGQAGATIANPFIGLGLGISGVSNQVYNDALKRTGDEESAMRALVYNIPTALLENALDVILIGKVGKFAKAATEIGKRDQLLNLLKGGVGASTREASAEVIEGVGQRNALRQATNQEDAGTDLFNRKQITEDAFLGGTVGLVLGGAGSALGNYRTNSNARELIKKANSEAVKLTNTIKAKVTTPLEIKSETVKVDGEILGERLPHPTTDVQESYGDYSFSRISDSSFGNGETVYSIDKTKTENKDPLAEQEKAPEFERPVVVKTSEEYSRIERQAGVLGEDANPELKVQSYLQDLGFDGIIKDYGDDQATAIKFETDATEFAQTNGEAQGILIDKDIVDDAKKEATPFSPDNNLLLQKDQAKASEQQRVSVLTALIQNSGIDLELFTNPRFGGGTVTGGFLAKAWKEGIKVYNRLFRDSRDAMTVMSHEFGHFTDYFSEAIRNQNEGVGTQDSSLLGKLTQVADNGVQAFNNITPAESKEVTRELLNVSKLFRPDDSTSFSRNPNQFRYRMSAKEIYADFFGAYLTNPELVKTVAPTAWKIFQGSINKSPKLQQIMTEYGKAVSDPDFAFNLVKENQAKALEAEKKQLVEGMEQRVSNTESQRRRQANSILQQIKAFFFNEKIRPLQDLKKLLKEGKISKEEFHERRNEIESLGNLNAKVKQFTASTLSAIEPILAKIGISPVEFHDYLLSKRISEETNSFVKFTQDFPQEAKALLEDLNSFVQSELAISKKDKERISSLIQDGQLANASAKINQVLSLMRPSSRSKFLNRVFQSITTKTTPQANNKKVKFTNTVASDNAFNIRRYLANPFGITLEDAQKRVRQMESKLTNEQLADLKEASKILNERSWMVMVRANQVGIISDEDLKQAEANKDNYVTFSVLRHRDADFRVNPNIVEQTVGTLDAIGNTYTNTVAKMDALLKMTEAQNIRNKVIELASIDGGAKEVTFSNGSKVRSDQVGALKAKLEERENKKHQDLYGGIVINMSKKSYLIGKKDGESTLYEFEDPFYTNFLNSGAMTPSAGYVLGPLKFISKIEMPLRTGLNAFFLVTSKIKAGGALANVQGVLQDRKLPVFRFLHYVLDSGVQEAIANNRKNAQTYAKFLTEGEKLPANLQGLVGVLGSTGKSNTLGYSNLIAPEIEVSPSDNYNENVKNSEYEIALLLGQTPIVPSYIERRLSDANFFIGKTPLVGQVWRFGGSIMEWINFQNVKQEYLEKFATRDLALKAGLTEAEANALMRDTAGNPNSTGGGRGARMLNDYFAYFRPAMNSLTAVGELYKINPKAYARHQLYSLLGMAKNHPAISSLLLGGLVKAGVLSSEMEEKIQKGLDMLSRYDKSLNHVMPLFFVDPQGNWTSIFNPDLRARDIGGNWNVVSFKEKLAFTQEPQARIFYSLLDAISDNNPQDGILKMMAKDFGSSIPGLMPGIESGLALARFALGENPYNAFTQRGALNEEIYQSGDLVNNSMEMAKYLLSKTGYYNYTPYSTSTKSGNSIIPVLGDIPVVGKKIANLFLATGNYGLVEKDKANLARETRTKAQIKSLLPSKISEAYHEYSSLKRRGAVTRTPQEQIRYGELTRFMRVYEGYENEIADFMRRGDSEEVEKLVEELDRDFEAGARTWVKLSNKGRSKPVTLETIRRQALQRQEKAIKKEEESNE